MKAFPAPSGPDICGANLPPLRDPDTVMKLERMGAFFPHRLSFMRSFIRRMAREGSTLTIPVCSLDHDGYGHVVLTLPLAGHDYSLIAFSRPLDDADRTDRVIATKWDASFCLYDGVPGEDDIAALAEQVTRQEAGRYHDRVLTLSRANKSLRLFNLVVDALAEGRQPDHDRIVSIGYLMRTTAVYGNGKFGIADRDRIARRPGLQGPFQAEMLTVFLIREFTLFLAEYCAEQQGGDKAISLDPAIRRYLGIGNSTGLGMAPFLVNHPILLHSWIVAREVALTRARDLTKASDDQLKGFDRLLDRAIRHCHEWQVDDEIQMQRIITLRAELTRLQAEIARTPLARQNPLDDAFTRAQSLSLEAQEMMVSIIIELIPEQVDDLAECMANPNEPRLFPAMTIGELKNLLNEHYRWVDAIDPDSRGADEQFWYTSVEKLEPRLGNRYQEPGAEREMPFNIPLYIRRLQMDLEQGQIADDETVAVFLMRFPWHRHIIRRVQTTARYPFAEIRDNLVDARCRPIDLLRCKLSFFGASKFDPKSDRWTRITLFHGAPTAAELADGHLECLDDWIFALGPAAAMPDAIRAADAGIQ